MARHCVKWARGKKRGKGRKKGAHCAHGRVKSGPRKGRCRKHKVSRKRRVNTATRGRYIFHGI